MKILSKISIRNVLLNLFSSVSLFLLFTSNAFAVIPEYTPLVGLPGVTDQGAMSLPNYLNVIYLTVIGIGALVGVIKIGMAGVKYSLSDVVTNKESARHDIMGVLLGLAILLIPFIVLNTIYPKLTSLDVLNRASGLKVNLEPSRAKTGDGGGAVATPPIPGTLTPTACGALGGTLTGPGGTLCSNAKGSVSSPMTPAACDGLRGGYSSVDGTCNNIPVRQ